MVIRGGAIVKVTGSWPLPRRFERRGLMVPAPLRRRGRDVATRAGYAPPVHHIEPGSDAEAAAIQQFDLLVSVDHQPVGSLEALYAAIERARKETVHCGDAAAVASEAVTGSSSTSSVLPAEDVGG